MKSRNIASQNRNSDSTKSGSSTYKKSYTGHEGQIYSLVVINSEQIATAGDDKVIKLWNLKTSECSMELSGHQSTIWDLKAGFEGRYVFSASEDKDIRVWKILEGECRKTLTGHKAPVTSLGLLESKRLLVSGSKEGAVLVWDLEEKKVKYEMNGHGCAITAIEPFKVDNVLTAAEDGYMKFWDIKARALIKTFEISEGKITSLCAFTNGMSKVLAGDSNGELKVWDLETGKQVASIKAHTNSVCAVSVSNDGTLVASGGADKALKIWDLKTCSLLKQIGENDSSVRCVQFIDKSSVLYCDTNPKKYKFSSY